MIRVPMIRVLMIRVLMIRALMWRAPNLVLGSGNSSLARRQHGVKNWGNSKVTGLSAISYQQFSSWQLAVGSWQLAVGSWQLAISVWPFRVRWQRDC